MIDARPQVERLLDSPEPAIRLKIRLSVFDADPSSSEILALREAVRGSETVSALLQRDASGTPHFLGDKVYTKWKGPHWILSALADLGYPPGDEVLRPTVSRLFDVWLGDQFQTEFEAGSKAGAYSKQGIPIVNGRHRSHASQQGNALWTAHKLGLADERSDQLVERLLHWQWPDGGWNCDKKPEADTSSFMESIFPLRGLHLHAVATGSNAAALASEQAAEIFLSRRLYRRKGNGNFMRSEFVKLHYPLYWRYDVLGGLKAMAETGHIDDPRCQDALDLLASMQLNDGGWPAHVKFYTARSEIKLGNDFVDWGGTSKRKANDWVTADAISVLAKAGRLN